MDNLITLRKILKFDWLLIFMILLLVCIGCLSLYSAAGGDWNPWANRHFQRSIIGFILAIAIAITDIKIIYKYAWLPFIISIILLLTLSCLHPKNKIEVNITKRSIKYYIN